MLTLVMMNDKVETELEKLVEPFVDFLVNKGYFLQTIL